MRALVETVVQNAGGLLLQCTQDACDGTVDTVEARHLQKQVEEVRADLRELVKEYRLVKIDLDLGPITSSFCDEQCFVVHVSAFGRISMELAEALIADQNGKKPLPPIPSSFFWSTFDSNTLFEKKHLSFAVRNTLTVMLGLFIGCYGHRLNDTAFMAFDAGIASTSAVLLSDFQGSAMQKNMQRLQGVTMGNLLGGVAFALLGGCDVLSNVGLSVALFSCLTCSLYMYYDFVEYSSTGLLLAYYGAAGMLAGCGGHLQTASFYYKVADCTASLFLTILVDSMLAHERAAQLTICKFRESWRDICNTCEEYLSMKTENLELVTSLTESLELKKQVAPASALTAKAPEVLLQEIVSAQALGEEAGREPAYGRPPFNSDVFATGVTCALHIRTHLNSMEKALSKDASCGGKAFVLMQLKSFKAIKEIVCGRLRNIEELINKFDPEDMAPRVRCIPKDCSYLSDFEKKLEEFCQDVADQAKLEAEVHGDNAEEDACSSVAVVISSCRGMLKEACIIYMALQSVGP